MKLSLACCMAVLFARIGLSCGINWNQPRSKIDGCNEQGYVLITEKLADLDIPGEKATVPIWATFDSSRQTASPYAGMGWRIPFLECSLVQISEDEFQLTEPGGWRRLFRRAGKGSDVLDGGGGWKGQLSPDHATLWADCGWRIELHKGKIVQMKTPHGQTISYNYSNGRVSSVVCGMKTMIAIDPADGPDHRVGMTIDGTRYNIAKADQPRVQRIEGVNIVAGSDLSFAQATAADRQTRTFAYSVDDLTCPVLTITDAAKREKVVSWEPETRRITRYGEWNYDIKPASSPLENSAIGRTNTKGQTEFWHYDGEHGREIMQQIDGVKNVTSWFVSGKLAGKSREERTESGKTLLALIKYHYDEDGRVIRIADAQDNPSYEAVYKEGNLIREVFDGRTTQISRAGNTQIMTTTMPSGRTIVRQIDKNGNLLDLKVKQTQMQ